MICFLLLYIYEVFGNNFNVHYCYAGIRVLIPSLVEAWLFIKFRLLHRFTRAPDKVNTGKQGLPLSVAPRPYQAWRLSPTKRGA